MFIGLQNPSNFVTTSMWKVNAQTTIGRISSSLAWEPEEGKKEGGWRAF